jgi:hypothetical protein
MTDSAHSTVSANLDEHMADLDEFLAAHEAEHGPIHDAVMNDVRAAGPAGRASRRR